ncbi:hypothetical protein ACMD2_10408 [Ananas comosus]|uniref:Uncharacterized protein n=1 Tax=Ananas comosus TaxID=4615 RepID=A0A199UTK2_ANACO|nr:hypothetical protein ACMD2_10408 [Ananas comosus]
MARHHMPIDPPLLLLQWLLRLKSSDLFYNSFHLCYQHLRSIGHHYTAALHHAALVEKDLFGHMR